MPMVSEIPDYEVGEYGGAEALVVRQWSKGCEEELRAKQRLVVLNQARGWKPQSLSFLAGLEIEQLAVLAHVPIAGLVCVASIRNLRKLSLDCEPTETVPLDQVRRSSPAGLPGPASTARSSRCLR
jgi:hypothetical protein